MKKMMILVLFVITFMIGSSTTVSANITHSTGWTEYSDYASNIGLYVDTSIWECKGFYMKYITSTNDNEDNRDYGNVRIYIGVYHTISTEYYIPPYGTPQFFDNFMIVYKVITYTQISSNEQGYIEYVNVYSDVDQNNYWDNIILQYGPQSANEGTTYSIGTSLGVNSNGVSSFSMNMTQSITLYNRTIDSSLTNDPIFNVKYKYQKSKSNQYAIGQREHYGFFIVESGCNDYDFQIKFVAYFSDFDYELFQDYQHTKFTEDFFFYMN